MLRHWLLIAGLLSPAFSFASTQTFGPAPGAPGQIQYKFKGCVGLNNILANIKSGGVNVEFFGNSKDITEITICGNMDLFASSSVKIFERIATLAEFNGCFAATTNSNLVTISILKMPLIQEINDSKDTYLVDGKAYHQRSNSRTLDSYLCVLDPKEIEYPYDKIPVTSDF